VVAVAHAVGGRTGAVIEELMVVAFMLCLR
jgi:hypothetical protein